MQVEHHLGTRGVEDAALLAAGDDAEGLGDMALAHARIADEDEILMAIDQGELGEIEDDGLVELGLEGEVEGLEGGTLRQMCILEAPSDAPLSAVVDLGAQESLDGFEGLRASRNVGGQKIGEHRERPLHAEALEQGSDTAFDIARHQSSGSVGTGASASA